MPTETASLEVVVAQTNQIDTSLAGVVAGTNQVATGLDLASLAPVTYGGMRVWNVGSRYFGRDATAVSDTDRFDSLPGSLVDATTWGTVTLGYRHLYCTVSGATPDLVSYDKATVLTGAAGSVDFSQVASRAIFEFQLVQVDDDASITLGLCTAQGTSPVADAAAGNVVSFTLETQGGHAQFRAQAGTFASNRVPLGPPGLLVGPHMFVEIECVGASVGSSQVAFRLFNRDLSVDRPVAELTIDTPTAPTVTALGIWGQGRVSVERPVGFVAVNWRGWGVERQAGATQVYTPSPVVSLAEAAVRPYSPVVPCQVGAGTNTLQVQLVDPAEPDSDIASLTYQVDPAEPTITVVGFTAPATRVPDALSPPIVKGSDKAGFREVEMQWHANKPGTWTLRANSTGVSDGVELAAGVYPVALVVETTGWDMADLPAEGVWDVTLYLVGDSGVASAHRLGEYLLDPGGTANIVSLSAATDVAVAAYATPGYVNSQVGVLRWDLANPSVINIGWTPAVGNTLMLYAYLYLGGPLSTPSQTNQTWTSMFQSGTVLSRRHELYGTDVVSGFGSTITIASLGGTTPAGYMLVEYSGVAPVASQLAFVGGDALHHAHLTDPVVTASRTAPQFVGGFPSGTSLLFGGLIDTTAPTDVVQTPVTGYTEQAAGFDTGGTGSRWYLSVSDLPHTATPTVPGPTVLTTSAGGSANVSMTLLAIDLLADLVV